MYNPYTVGKILLQASTNGSFQLTRHFPTENEWFISWILIYPCLHRWTFDILKSILEISYTESGINTKLAEKGLKCNIEKAFFGKTKMEYLGF